MANTKDSDQPPAAKGTPAAPSKGPVPVHIGGDSIVDRLLPHVKKIAIALGVVAVILTAVFGWRWWKDRARGQETAKFAAAMKVAARDIKKPDPTEKPDPTHPAETTYGTVKERAAAVLTELERGGGAGLATDAYRGSLLLDAGRLDDAEATFKRASARADLEGVLAREGLGFVAEARAAASKDAAESQRFLEAALAAFRAVQPDDKGPHRDYALYHEARILAQLNKKADAVAALEKALEVAPESPLESTIHDRLAQLEGTP